MFTPLNHKKLINVSIISLKKYNRQYSITVYPNKIYEYQKNISPLSEVLINQTIYKNVNLGEKCSKEDLSYFNKPLLDIIKEIIDTGHEQKNTITREYEKDQVEIKIIDTVRKKIMKDNKFLSRDDIKKAIKSVYNIQNKDIKVQVLDILNLLEKQGFERVKMKILVGDDIIYIGGGEFIKFREECKKNKVEFIVKKNIESYEEELI